MKENFGPEYRLQLEHLVIKRWLQLPLEKQVEVVRELIQKMESKDFLKLADKIISL